MDYPEPDYERTAQEKMIEVLECVIKDYPGNEHFRRFVYQPVEPAASESLKTQALAGAQ